MQEEEYHNSLMKKEDKLIASIDQMIPAISFKDMPP
jgi:hypothetical protein